MPGTQAQRGRRPWYLRPLPLAAILVPLLLVLATIPPLLASPTPVNLDEQGQQNAKVDGWQPIDIGSESHIEIAGGLVTLQTQALQKNDADGYPVAGYTWVSLKVPAMLPRELVEDRLRASALEAVDGILQELGTEHTTGGIQLDTRAIEETPFTQNGHDAKLTRYRASALLSEQLPDRIRVADDETLHGEAFIATWRCSILGSYALAFGFARDEPILEADPDANGRLNDDPLGLGELLEQADDAREDTLHVTVEGLERSGSQHIQQIQQRLLAHTICGE